MGRRCSSTASPCRTVVAAAHRHLRGGRRAHQDDEDRARPLLHDGRLPGTPVTAATGARCRLVHHRQGRPHHLEERAPLVPLVLIRTRSGEQRSLLIEARHLELRHRAESGGRDAEASRWRVQRPGRCPSARLAEAPPPRCGRRRDTVRGVDDVAVGTVASIHSAWGRPGVLTRMQIGLMPDTASSVGDDQWSPRRAGTRWHRGRCRCSAWRRRRSPAASPTMANTAHRRSRVQWRGSGESDGECRRSAGRA